MEDWAKYFRYKNLLTISDKVEALHTRRKLEGKTNLIPLRTAIPLLESASLEDDKTLQDVWARLIANSMDSNFKEPVHPVYIEIVKQLSADEAVILKAFREIENYPKLFENQFIKEQSRSILFALMPQQRQPFDGICTKLSKFCENLPLKHPTELRIYLNNLERLKLLELRDDLSQRIADSDQTTYRGAIKVTHSESMEMTALGVGFIEACIKND